MEPVFNGNFTLRQLSHFVAVAECGTVSGAAVELNMSQSAVSASITELERTLGSQLCIRRKAQGVTLTPTGQVVLDRARSLLAEAGELGYLVKGGEHLVGPLTVGCLVTLAPTVLTPLIDGFPAAHPGVALDFVEASQDVLWHELESGALDLAILWDLDVGKRWNVLPLYSIRPYVLLAAGHPLAEREIVALKDLEREPMVLLDPHPSAHNTMLALERAGIEPRVRYRPHSFEFARALVGRGLGWTFLFQRPKGDVSYEGLPVVMREIEEDVESIDVAIVWSRDTKLTPRAEAFAHYAMQTARAAFRQNR